jgi:uncharacterized protein (TIGR04255 family)
MSQKLKKYKSYKKPPIIEAVIEVRFQESLSNEQLEKVFLKQKAKFTVQKIEEFGIRLSHNDKTGTQAETSSSLVGFKLIDNADNSNIVQIKHNSVSVSRFPPYEGWPSLLETFVRYFDLYTNKKFKTTSRIGVRYINRIDIPFSNDKITLENYFKIYPKFPKKFPDINRFVVNSISPIDSDRMLTINIHSAPDNPLINHGSFIFDLDVAQMVNLPTTSANLYKLLDIIRDKKDFLFESLLTPACKRLFQ